MDLPKLRPDWPSDGTIARSVGNLRELGESAKMRLYTPENLREWRIQING